MKDDSNNMAKNYVFARENLIINIDFLVSADFNPNGVNPTQKPSLSLTLAGQSDTGGASHTVTLVNEDAEDFWNYLRQNAQQVRS